MKYCCFLICFFAFFLSIAQVKVSFKVSDSLQRPIPDAYVFLNGKSKSTNTNGIASFVAKKGKYNVLIEHLGYQKYTVQLQITTNKVYAILLKENKEMLQEVVVTAKESDDITSTSIIDKRAMSHIQPSSFSDVMSLLPGNNVNSPVLNSANTVLLRETGISAEGYETSSLGASFVVDDMPLNSNANFQETVISNFQINPLSFGGVDQRRRTVRSGIDMRAISTDEIEKVEVVRGVASARYGDLSSGLIKIERKNGQTKWNSRIKSDGFSKLFHLGKGFYFDRSNMSFNFGLDYLDAKSDPRNELENYERIVASVRFKKRFETPNPLTWKLSVDYTRTLDGEETDPDIGIENLDSYKSSYNSVRVSNEFDADFSEGFLKNLNLRFSVNSSNDRIEQTRWRQITRPTSLSINTEEGEGYGIFLEPSYLSFLVVDGKPLDVFSDLSGMFKFNVFAVKNELTSGVSYSYSKNNGLGQLYDITRPPAPTGSIDTRPRAFKDIPAMQHVAFYVEDRMRWSLHKTNFTFSVGVRGSSIIGLDENYEIAGKLFVNPRLNLKIDLPKITFANKKVLAVNLTGGYGKQNKLPTQSMLFPQDRYVDYEQLNYFHPNNDFRRVHYQTYVLPQVNYSITPALNTKKELRLGLNYDYHSLYLTYFDERMTSGFRRVFKQYQTSFKVYDTSGLDANTITAAPAVEDLPFSVENTQALTTEESNGSGIDKKGVEFQYAGKRFKTIQTRFTVNGAWLQSKYYNSGPFLDFAENRVVNGVFHSNIGVYENDDSYLRETLQTSIIADTYLQNLGLTTSLRADVNWYGKTVGLLRSTVPVQYINELGVTLPYTAVEANDPVLKTLIKTPDEITERNTPLSLNVHLKISKQFHKYFTVSMYVNNLFNYNKVNSLGDQAVAQRRFTDPYFGMEMNINF